MAGSHRWIPGWHKQPCRPAGRLPGVPGYALRRMQSSNWHPGGLGERPDAAACADLAAASPMCCACRGSRSERGDQAG